MRAELARQQRFGTWMAKQMGMTQSTWSRRVTGDLPFDVAELDRIASILNVPISSFLGVQAEDPGVRYRRTCRPDELVAA